MHLWGVAGVRGEEAQHPRSGWVCKQEALSGPGDGQSFCPAWGWDPPFRRAASSEGFLTVPWAATSWRGPQVPGKPVVKPGHVLGPLCAACVQSALQTPDVVCWYRV